MKVSVLIITHNRTKELGEALASVNSQNYQDMEVIVVDNGSSNLQEISRICTPFQKVRLIRSQLNLGVEGGRNFGLAYCTGDIILNLDDDAELSGVEFVRDMVNAFLKNPRLGIVAFRIVNYFTGRVDKKEFSGRDLRMVEEEFLTSYFCGGGNAILKKVLEQVKGYEERLFYGGEELFVAHQAINLGYNIIYSPCLKVYHKTSPVRMPSRDYYYYLGRNRVWICAQLIPFPYVIGNFLVWLAYGAYHSLCNKALHKFIVGLINGCSEMGYFFENRLKYTPTALEYLKSHQGRLWY